MADNAVLDLETDLDIERMVMDLYGITAQERQRVWDTLREVQGVQSVSDLVPRDEIGSMLEP